MAEPNAKGMTAPVEEVGEMTWDPLLASDWDHQKPSSEAIVRMKRYNSRKLAYYSNHSDTVEIYTPYSAIRCQEYSSYPTKMMSHE